MAGDFIEDFLGYMNLIHHISANENAKNTQKMIQLIVNHIKYKYIRKDEIVMLKEELLQIDNLIGIFKARFGSGLQVTDTIKDEYDSLYLPNYSIAAFVENALYHGLIPLDGEWRLSLSIEESEKDVKIQIIDNGIGFDTSVLNFNENKIQQVNANIGTIEDITTKLKSCYGKDEQIEIFSTQGKGTKVEITIPKI